MAVRAIRKSPASTPCRIARFLGVDIVQDAGHGGIAGRPYGETPRGEAIVRCCEEGECPNARLMFDLMFDRIETPNRAQMH